MKDIKGRMQEHLDMLTKPKGSLGRLEEVAVRLAVIQDRVPPKIEKKGVLVFAGDHGVTEEGVSLYPKEVTAQMVLNFMSGGAAINAFSNQGGYSMTVVDVGVAGDLGQAPLEMNRRSSGVEFVDGKAGPGTANIAAGQAMKEEQLLSIERLTEDLADRFDEEGYDLVALGDMGIGNTTSAAALALALGLGEEVIDRGTGITEEQLAHKREVTLQAVEVNGPYSGPRDAVRKLAGFEQAAIYAMVLALRDRGIVCITDGFPVTAGVYAAYSEDPGVAEFLIAGHRSKVRGHELLLSAMGLHPLLTLEMRLGEGTGAVLGGMLVESAARFSSEMASFDDAGVSGSEDEEESY